MRRGIVRLALAAASLLLLAPPTRAQATGGGLEDALAAVGDRTDVVVIEDPPPRQPTVIAATMVKAAPGSVLAVVTRPRAFGAALPSLVKTDVVATRQRERTTELRVEWELEVPLFNLAGKMWVRPLPDGAEMVLDQGDFSPGRFVFRLRPASAGRTLLWLQGRANLRGSSWVMRRLIAKTALAEPAITALTALVLVRATAALAEHPATPAARRPAPPASLPVPETVDPAVALAIPEIPGAVVATVQRDTAGQLTAATATVRLPFDASTAAAALAQPLTWNGFPGWSVKPTGPAQAAVSVSIPFTALDATWEVRSREPLRVVATSGGVRGAVFAWGLRGGGSRECRAALALQPRLHAAGWVIRKFLAAEPLLDAGLAMALAYGDAVGTRKRLAGR